MNHSKRNVNQKRHYHTTTQMHYKDILYSERICKDIDNEENYHDKVENIHDMDLYPKIQQRRKSKLSQYRNITSSIRISGVVNLQCTKLTPGHYKLSWLPPTNQRRLHSEGGYEMRVRCNNDTTARYGVQTHVFTFELDLHCEPHIWVRRHDRYVIGVFNKSPVLCV